MQHRLALLVDPPEAASHGGKEIFEEHMAEHPLITHYEVTHDGRALKISDFLTQRQFHRLGLYNELYRRLGAEHHMAVTLPAPWPLVIGMALMRGRRDFTERERLCLDLLRPHLIRAYHNAEAVTRLQRELAAMGQTMEALERGVIVLGEKERVRMMTPRAQQWMTAYFGTRVGGFNRLPEALRRWLLHQAASLGDEGDVPPARPPLVMEREGGRLVVRLIRDGEQLVLLLEEQTALKPTILERFGLTRREAEVLLWVAEGKSDWEISVILSVSARTVQKHLEHIFAKLGVETRTAAVAWVYRVPWQER